jgi:hypothetical protein
MHVISVYITDPVCVFKYIFVTLKYFCKKLKFFKELKFFPQKQVINISRKRAFDISRLEY